MSNKRKNQYSNYIQELILNVLREDNYFIKTTYATASSIVKNEKEFFIKSLATNNIIGFIKSLRLSLFIKKQNIEWLVLAGSDKFFSSKLPQILIPSSIEKLRLNEPLPHSARIVIDSVTEKNQLLALYPFAEKHIYVVRFSINKSFQPVSWSEQQSLKLELTQGREFFLVRINDVSAGMFTSLLKAFTTFKKWQHSNMKLVINGVTHHAKLSELQEKLSTYKYREDVVLTNADFAGKEYIALLSSTYAFLHLPSSGNDVIPLLQAMQCEAPCISFTTPVIEEYSNDAILLIEPDNYEQLSEKMILLYKDENLRNKLIETGRQQAQTYSQTKAIEALTNALPANLH